MRQFVYDMIVFIKNIVLRNLKNTRRTEIICFLNIGKFVFLFLHVTTSKDRCLTKITYKKRYDVKFYNEKIDICLDYITNQD